jgi:CheY-like chemotaxis protein
MNMPGMDGLETCRLIRKQSEIAIVMLTVRDEEADNVNPTFQTRVFADRTVGWIPILAVPARGAGRPETCRRRDDSTSLMTRAQLRWKS